ncbi:MAG: hypothetical protein IJE58_09780 [Oscillospiraceae bacterium]|nr:hypothetical protein [Oscillospiraceae bacterium]
MKREYTRPDIVYEDFTLSTAIAGSCGVSTGLPSANQCGMDFGMDVVFTDVVSGCTKKVDDSGAFNGLCYHVFTDANRLFSS